MGGVNPEFNDLTNMLAGSVGPSPEFNDFDKYVCRNGHLYRGCDIIAKPTFRTI